MDCYHRWDFTRPHYISSYTLIYRNNDYNIKMRIFITRHGESTYNIENRLGGNPSLSEKGKEYARNLKTYIEEQYDFPQKCITSTKKRVLETIYWKKDFTSDKKLDEINAGVGEDMTYEEFAEIYPKEDKLRKKDKLNYRYPKGESYIDLLKRTKSIADTVIRENEDIFIVCHRAIARVLIYHFLHMHPKWVAMDKEDIPFTIVPLHTLIKIEDGDLTYINI